MLWKQLAGNRLFFSLTRYRSASYSNRPLKPATQASHLKASDSMTLAGRPVKAEAAVEWLINHQLAAHKLAVVVVVVFAPSTQTTVLEKEEVEQHLDKELVVSSATTSATATNKLAGRKLA